MSITEEQLNKIRMYGMLKYTPQRIAILLGFNWDERNSFLKMFLEPDNSVYHYYQRGIAEGDCNIDIALTKVAESGDVDAIERLNIVQAERQLDEMINDLLGI